MPQKYNLLPTDVDTRERTLTRLKVPITENGPFALIQSGQRVADLDTVSTASFEIPLFSRSNSLCS